MSADLDLNPSGTLAQSPDLSFRGRFIEIATNERAFLTILFVGFLLAGVLYEYPVAAAWFGFSLAGYAATTNDSIQTIGTFLASNAHRKWWVMWAFIATILVLTLSASWYLYDGDVSFQRLSAKGFEKSPTQFSFLQIAAPLFLLALTRMKIPVSTTFLCLSGFAATSAAIGSVLTKSLLGYGVAFSVALVVWSAAKRIPASAYDSKPHPMWYPVQWLASGGLWAVWLMQDAANLAVFLPRQLSFIELGGVLLVLVTGLGILFRLRGDKIQQVVTEKSNMVDVRAATAIDVTYAATLLVFQQMSQVPMSTTWVFVGLLGGRELALSLGAHGGKSLRQARRLIVKDIVSVSIGLLISLVIAASANPVIRDAWLGALGF